MMKTKDKFLILAAMFFVLIVVIVSLFNRSVCKSEMVETNLESLKNPDSIEEIRLFKAYDYPKTNLIDDTISITDKTQIELIREMINNRYSGIWNRQMSSWNVTMRIIFADKKSFDLCVRKIDDEKKPGLAHLYFGAFDCLGHAPNCSERLGDYLEEITCYSGENY